MTWQCRRCGSVELHAPSDGIPSCGRCPANRATLQQMDECVDANGVTLDNPPHAIELCMLCEHPVARSINQRFIGRTFLSCIECRLGRRVQCTHPSHIVWKHGKTLVSESDAVNATYTRRLPSGREEIQTSVVCSKCFSKCGGLSYTEALNYGVVSQATFPMELTPSVWERWNGRVLWSRKSVVIGERHIVSDMQFVRGMHRGRDVWYLHCNTWEREGDSFVTREDYVTLHHEVIKAVRLECESRDKSRNHNASLFQSVKGARVVRSGKTRPGNLGHCHIVMLGTKESPYASVRPIYQHKGESIPASFDRHLMAPLTVNKETGAVSL